MEKYDYKKIEKKWQENWDKAGIFKVSNNNDAKKFYCLDMFPYPSGEGLHVGHPKGYVATDVYSRYMMLKGYNVIHPMGFDSFGLPAENYAIKHKIHPQVAVNENIKRFKKQLKQFGFTYDWDREIITSDPEYYKWTQWIFLQMFKKGLAYESNEPINWCPSCKTGLANEDLENGKCERCGTQIEKKPMRQWVLKMTDYAERLLDDLNSKEIDWEKSIVEQQINWIGKSKGSEIDFSVIASKVKQSDRDDKTYLRIFTTRPDTIFGATYMVVAPEHELIINLKSQITNFKNIEKYIKKSKNKSDLERTDLAKEKTGVEIKGIKAINPANKKEIPIFVADYVLSSYGTGAIMAVPAHDERDFEFAKKFNLPIVQVIADKDKKIKLIDKPFIENGVLINSDKFNGIDSEEAKKKITKYLNGKETVKYKMRDWVFSRQRYWGEPIPLIHCKKCGIVAVPGDELPVKLPNIEHYEPTDTGESPLANIKDWVNTKCPKCGGPAKRETNTMPQWAGSSWYYLAYIMRENPKLEIINPKNIENFDKWLPVDLYVGGAEHATRHLLYARFWHKFLYDIKVVSTKEPFYRLQHVGLIRGEDERKMSKRWGNVVNPDDIIEQFGADAFRMYEMFMGPFADSVAWSTSGVKGTFRFLEKVWNYYQIESKGNDATDNDTKLLLNETITKVENDIKNFSFNTAISQMMIFINKIQNKTMSLDDKIKFLLVLSPFAPHMAEELYGKIGNKDTIYKLSWPKVEENITQKIEKVTVMINGKTRAVFDRETAKSQSDEAILKEVLVEPNILKYTTDKTIKKTIIKPTKTGKIVSLVI